MTKNKTDLLAYAIVFLLPVFFVLTALVHVGIYPFGSKAITASDLGIQYLPILYSAAEKIKNLAFYPMSYECGFGVNMYAFCMIFFNDIFSILFLISKAEFYQEILIIIYLLKIGSTGLNSYIFFSRSKIISCEKSVSIALSVLYPLCAQFILYILLILNINNFMLLPLCLLGAERIITDKKGGLFLAAYTACTFNSYYFAYMSGIMCFLYMIYFCIILDKAFDPKAFLRSTVHICLLAALAVCLSAVVILPQMGAVTSGYDGIFDSSPFDPLFIFDIKRVAAALFFITDKPAMQAGLSIYFGIIPLFLTLMLILSPKAAKRERIITAVLAVFMLLALSIKPLYLLMHIGRLPNEFDARFMYGAVFFYLIFSARAVMQSEKLSRHRLYIPFIVCVAGLGLALSAEATPRYLINAAIVLVLTAAYIAVILKCKKHLCLTIAVFILAEAFYSAFGGIAVIADKTVFPERSIYTSLLNTEKNNAAVLKKLDSGFFRSYDINDRSVISQLYGGYNSYSFFSSSANQKVTAFAKAMGARTPAPHALFHNNASIVTDSIFGVKYILVSGNDTSDIPKRFFTDIYKQKLDDTSVRVLENTAAFPIIFAANNAVLDCSQGFLDPVSLNGVFTNRQLFLGAITGRDIPLYEEYALEAPVLKNALTAQNDALNYLRPANLPDGSLYAADETQLASAVYTFTVPAAGEYCTDTYFSQNGPAVYTFKINGRPMTYNYETERTPYDIGYFEKGDTLTFEIETGTELQYTVPTVVRLDTEALKDVSAQVQGSALSDIKEEKGVIYASSHFDEEKTIFSSIAYDKGLIVLIDGKTTKTQEAAGAFTAFTLPKGSHKIEIRYTAPYFKTGAVISAAALLTTLGYIITKKRRRK